MELNEQTEIFYENLVLNKGANSLEIRISFDPVIQGGGTYSLQCTLYTASNSGCSKLTYISPWDNSGNLSFSITAPRPTVYGVGVRSMTERPGRQTIYGTPDVEYNVYVDGDLYTTKWTISHSGIGIPIDPFFGKVYLTSGHTPTERVSYNNTASASAKKGDENLCTAIIGNLEKDFLTTTITKGSEYLSFYDAVTGSFIGDSYREDINGIYANLKYDTPYYSTEDYQAEITTEVNGYTKSATFKLIPEECGTGAPECAEVTEAPEINITQHENLAFGYDVCFNTNKPDGKQLGGHIPIPGKLLNPIVVFPCFDSNNSLWKFNVNNIQLNVIIDFCEEWLGHFKVINSISEVDSNDICNALKDFDDHKTYPLNIRLGGYIIMEVLRKHEDAHKKTYEKYMLRKKNELDQKIKDFSITCYKVQNYLDAQYEGQKDIFQIISSQLANNFSEWSWDTGNNKLNPDYKKLRDLNEQNTHAKVQFLILQYKLELMRKYKSWVWCI